MSAAIAGAANSALSAAKIAAAENCPRFMTASSELCVSLRSRRREITRDQRSKAPHHRKASGRLALEHAQRRLAVNAQQLRALEAARARDAARLALEQRGPAKHLAFLQHEAASPGASVAP